MRVGRALGLGFGWETGLVAVAEGLSPTDEEVDAEMARLAQQYQMAPDLFRQQVETAGQMPAVRSDLEKGKALEWLVEHA